ncbi:MAG: hypothetical protein GWN71_29640, partial [Gammaproteobacteria bacterium]|nr:hypothetical protein [Gemmatimonadota bacterium]NIU77569.1 hypothetical protein [Gammaproteobacteria bacterium]
GHLAPVAFAKPLGTRSPGAGRSGDAQSLHRHARRELAHGRGAGSRGARLDHLSRRPVGQPGEPVVRRSDSPVGR